MKHADTSDSAEQVQRGAVWHLNGLYAVNADTNERVYVRELLDIGSYEFNFSKLSNEQRLAIISSIGESDPSNAHIRVREIARVFEEFGLIGARTEEMTRELSGLGALLSAKSTQMRDDTLADLRPLSDGFDERPVAALAVLPTCLRVPEIHLTAALVLRRRPPGNRAIFPLHSICARNAARRATERDSTSPRRRKSSKRNPNPSSQASTQHHRGSPN